jgi:hypothetical protein
MNNIIKQILKDKNCLIYTYNEVTNIIEQNNYNGSSFNQIRELSNIIDTLNQKNIEYKILINGIHIITD